MTASTHLPASRPASGRRSAALDEGAGERPDKSRGVGGVPSVKTFGILEAVVRGGRPLSATELSRIAGVPKPTMHRIVRMLEVEGLLLREPGQRRYLPGPRLFEFAIGVIQASMGTTLRHAILEALSTGIGETCNLGMMVDTHIVYLDRVEAAWPLGLRFEPGSRVPLHCTAMGKLFLAQLPEAKRNHLLDILPLDRYTQNTLTDARALAAALDAIHKCGYAIDEEEFLAGVVCLAVPIRNGEGIPVAALAVSAPAVRMSKSQALGHLGKLKKAATRLGATLGPGDDRSDRTRSSQSFGEG